MTVTNTLKCIMAFLSVWWECCYLSNILHTATRTRLSQEVCLDIWMVERMQIFLLVLHDQREQRKSCGLLFAQTYNNQNATEPSGWWVAYCKLVLALSEPSLFQVENLLWPLKSWNMQKDPVFGLSFRTFAETWRTMCEQCVSSPPVHIKGSGDENTRILIFRWLNTHENIIMNIPFVPLNPMKSCTLEL